MGCERKGPPDAADRRLTESTGLGHVACGPMRGRLRLALQSACQHPLHMPIAQLARRTWPRLIQQTVEASIEKPLPPLARRRQRASLPSRDIGVAQPIGRQQYNP